MRVKAKISECEPIQDLMSSFIDSMATEEETERLQSHLDECEPCQRQLQSFISVRALLARMEPVPVPEDLILDTRIRLSHVRSRDEYARWQTHLNNVLKPLAVPAVMGVSLTLLFFGILFGSLVSGPGLLRDTGGPTIATYQPLRTTAAFGASADASIEQPMFDETLSIVTDVSNVGRVFDYRIVSGTRTAAVDRWVREILFLAQFRPATSFGVPVRSTIILSFVDVRS